MGSVIPAIVCSLLALWFSAVAMRRCLVVRSDEHGQRGPMSAVARWLWAVMILCCVVTCLTFIAMAWYDIGWRGMDGAVEGSLASRYALYTACFSYGLAWLEERGGIKLPRLHKRGQKLLPPMKD